MADNSVFTGQDGNIYVDFDVQNLIIVDPNKLQDNDGKIRERLVDQENLVMYANLETKLLPRTKLAVGSSNQDAIQTVNIAEINFLKPAGQKYLTNEYTNEMTGEGIFNKGGNNQSSASQNPQMSNKPQATIQSGTEARSNDTGLLGITSINVKINTSFVPQVDILLEDVQGRALFEKGDQSPYAAFFNLPYPPFYLTLKGFYGQAIRYQLNLISFNASFNTFSGNYQVSLKFYGYKYNILNEITLASVLAVPHMYESTYTVNNADPNSSTSSPQSLVVEGGMQKIKEVYSEYKAKALIPKDFPELSLPALLNRLELFEKNIENSWTKANVQSLTEAKVFNNVLIDYENKVFNGNTSWYAKNIDSTLPVVLYGGLNFSAGTTVYQLKKEVKEGQTAAGASSAQQAQAQLNAIIKDQNTKLATNPVFGSDVAKDKNLVVKNDVDLGDFIIKVNPKTLDIGATYKLRTKNQTPLTGAAEVQYREQLYNELGFGILKIPVDGKEPQTDLYIFQGADRFVGLIQKMRQRLNELAQKEEEKLTLQLAARFEDKANGIGFIPTIRNVITVIMASAEAFIRLMDDVHKDAWEQRNDPDRRRAVLKYPSSDAKDNVSIVGKEDIDPIYPWPQFFIENNGNDERFQIKYPGDPSVVDLTKGYVFEKWPEIQFVEEFIKAQTEKKQPIKETGSEDNQEQSINRLTLNALEFPQTNIPYFSKEEVKFFFEIWERTYLSSHYTRLYQGGNVKSIYETLGKNEANNIKVALGLSSPYLIQKLKNYGFNFKNYLGFMSHISNQGTGPSIQKLIRDIFVTPYIQGEVEEDFNIYDNSTIASDSPSVNFGLDPKDLVDLNSLIKKNRKPDFCDTYPFTDSNWNLGNLANGVTSQAGLFYETKNTLFVNTEKKVISNFEKETTSTQVRPVTNFSYKNFNVPVVVFDNIDLFYTTRVTDPSKFVVTEGIINNSLSSGISPETTTSMLNTPYFVNAIQNGVQDWRDKKEYPFVQGAYLLLNSLPLATLRERYKTKDQLTDLDYIASSMKRFGAIHKMPYPWILKMGSIYHRYKRVVQDSVDILDTCWKDFDYIKNFDPIGNNIDKTYSLSFDGVNKEIINLQSYSAQTLPLPGVVIGTFTATTTTVQGGFYPKLINDCNMFFNGTDCFTTYTDTEIQLYSDSSLRVASIESGNINQNYISGTSLFNNFKMRPWSVVMNRKGAESYYTIPSFGSQYNQVTLSVFGQTTEGNFIAEQNLLSNNSIYNGTVRSFWGAPNYGYFDNRFASKPAYNQYINFINPTQPVSPFKLMNAQVEYSSVEEIFSVFTTTQLEKFESEFLKFSKSVYNINDVVGPSQPKVTLNVDPNDPDRYLKNFQLMVREFMEISGPSDPLLLLNDQKYLTEGISKQFGNITTILNNFMEYDVVIKLGNPSNYDRRLFDSFLPNYETGYEFSDTTQNASAPTQTGFRLVDPLKFDVYIPGSLPTKGGTTTLAASVSAYRDAWKELQLQVGFSTIPNLRYSDQGSYITDFFVTNDINFTKENVKICTPLIKIFATQKLSNGGTLSKEQFQNNLKSYSDNLIDFQKNIFNNLMTYLQKELPNISTVPEGGIKSAIDGEIPKVQFWEMFKALNDKWIAGNTYSEDTLLQDFLFLDRGSRNIGDKILVDPFILKDKLRYLNSSASVFTLISGILVENHFSVMPLPAYVNFYNVQTPDGTSTPKTEASVDFANSIWGTFLSVDYRKSSPKMVCFYSEKPSAYANGAGNKDYRYKNDGFSCKSVTDNPTLEDQTNKTDWALSNRCVGFNVDMGVRNQGVFYNFSISQDLGKATSESLVATNQLGNQASGRKVTSQNVSLLNIYNERSYQANVVALGNALIQPMMYFCLNHVPMFNGAYLITEVNHTISPGVFQTSFTGTRQRIFAAPKINNYLISLNQNLLQKLEEKLKIAQTTPTTAATTETSKKSNAAPNSCVGSLNKKYEKGFEAINSTSTKTTTLDLFSNIYKNRPASRSDRQQKTLTFAAFAFAYVMSYENSAIQGYNNNYGNVDLGEDWGGAGTNNFLKTYCCVNIGTDRGSKPKPFANFASIDNFSKLMLARLDVNFDQIKEFYPGTILPTADALYNYFKAAWPKNKKEKEQSDFEKNQGKEVRAKFDKAVLEIRALAPQLNIDLAVSTPSPSSSQNVPNVTPTPTPSPAAVNQVQTPNADDRTILSNAGKATESLTSVGYSLIASTSSNGLLTITGNIGSSPLSRSYKLKVYLISFEGTQSETVIGETQLIPKSLGQNNGYTFTTSKSFRRECDIAADQTNSSIGFKVQVIEYPEYQYANTFRVMKYDCPTRNLLPGDVVNRAVYEQINANPCAICYPNGGPGIIINGKECLPNTKQPRQNIFNTTTDKDSTGRIIKVTFTIKPDAGIWKIFTGKYDSKCVGTTAFNTTSGEISQNQQSVSFDIVDIIDGCDPGSYRVKVECTAQPYLANGQLDNTKIQDYASYVVEGII
jgi:hypothetical protein